MRKRPKPFCKRDGCPNRVKYHQCQYCLYACVPRAQRVNAGIKGRQSYARQQRAKKYGAAWVRYRMSPTKEDFFAVVADLCRSEWMNGYQSCEKKWARVGSRRTAA